MPFMGLWYTLVNKGGEMKITVYGSMTCPYCFALKDWLDEMGVKYEYYFVDHDQKKAEEMMNLSGQGGVPFTTIETEDGKMEKILGFDRAKFIKILQKGEKK
jgi:glutaredoxin